MTEPPRPPGDATSGSPDPLSPPPPAPGSYSSPGEAPAPGYPPPAGGYEPQPPAGGYQPQPPAGGYQPQPPPPPAAGYGPTSGAPGGYGPPPATPGGYGASGGYQGGPAPAGYATNDDKTWALVSHFGGAVGALVSFGPLGFVAPLIAYLSKGQQSPAVRAHAVAALNFQILWSIIGFVVLFFSWCLLFVPSLILVLIQIIFGIIAGMKANEGQLYRYPMSVSIIK